MTTNAVSELMDMLLKSPDGSVPIIAPVLPKVLTPRLGPLEVLELARGLNFDGLTGMEINEAAGHLLEHGLTLHVLGWPDGVRAFITFKGEMPSPALGLAAYKAARMKLEQLVLEAAA